MGYFEPNLTEEMAQILMENEGWRNPKQIWVFHVPIEGTAFFLKCKIAIPEEVWFSVGETYSLFAVVSA